MLHAEVNPTGLLRRNNSEREFWLCYGDTLLDILAFLPPGDLKSCMLSCRGLYVCSHPLYAHDGWLYPAGSCGSCYLLGRFYETLPSVACRQWIIWEEVCGRV